MSSRKKLVHSWSTVSNDGSIDPTDKKKKSNKEWAKIVKTREKKEKKNLYYTPFAFDALLEESVDKQFHQNVCQILADYKSYDEAPDFLQYFGQLDEDDFQTVHTGFQCKEYRCEIAEDSLYSILVLKDKVARGKLSTAFLKIEKHVAEISKNQRMYKKNLAKIMQVVTSFIQMQRII